MNEETVEKQEAVMGEIERRLLILESREVPEGYGGILADIRSDVEDAEGCIADLQGLEGRVGDLVGIEAQIAALHVRVSALEAGKVVVIDPLAGKTNLERAQYRKELEKMSNEPATIQFVKHPPAPPAPPKKRKYTKRKKV